MSGMKVYLLFCKEADEETDDWELEPYCEGVVTDERIAQAYMAVRWLKEEQDDYYYQEVEVNDPRIFQALKEKGLL